MLKETKEFVGKHYMLIVIIVGKGQRACILFNFVCIKYVTMCAPFWSLYLSIRHVSMWLTAEVWLWVSSATYEKRGKRWRLRECTLWLTPHRGDVWEASKPATIKRMHSLCHSKYSLVLDWVAGLLSSVSFFFISLSLSLSLSSFEEDIIFLHCR